LFSELDGSLMKRTPGTSGLIPGVAGAGLLLFLLCCLLRRQV